MPRPQICRKVCDEPEYDEFSPEGIASGNNVILTVDEYEVIRLVDLEQKTHKEAAIQMEISRTTATEIYNCARKKIADCIVNGKRLIVSGGNYKICNGMSKKCCQKNCFKNKEIGFNNVTLSQKGKNNMRIAVTYENGEVFQHFGHTEFFKLYDIENEKIVNQEVVPTMGSGHGALAGFLASKGVDTLICGGIGGGAQTALSDIGIKLFGGVSGNADVAVNELLNGTLGFNPNVHCDHHDHEHGDGNHTCGEHGCGNHNCQ